MLFATIKRHLSDAFGSSHKQHSHSYLKQTRSTDHMLVGLVVAQVMATSLLFLVALLTLDIVEGWLHPVLMVGVGLSLVGLLVAGGYVLGAKFGRQTSGSLSQQMTELTSLRAEAANLRRQLRIAERQAQCAGEAKQAFVSQLNHDIRTPINHILGFTELIRNETFGKIGDARYVAYLDDIARSGKVLMQSFGQILELADFNSGSHRLNITNIECDMLEQRLRTDFCTRAQNAGVDLSLRFDALDGFQADQNCVMRVLNQLSSNAIAYTPRGGHVVIEAYCADETVIFCVTDTGIGMSPKQVEMLSVPMAFADFEHATRPSGKGMGLAMARTLTELSGGELRIESTLGIGTTAVATFPRAPLKIAEATREAKATAVLAA